MCAHNGIENVRVVCNEWGRCWQTRGPRYYSDSYNYYEPSYRYHRRHYHRGPGVHLDAPGVHFGFGFR